MKKPQHAKSFWSGKGFYLALTLVIAGAATASFLAINNMMDSLGTAPVPENFAEGDTPWQDQPLAPAEEKQPGVPVTPKSEPSSASTSESASSEAQSDSSATSSGASKRGSASSSMPSSAGSQPPVSSVPDASSAQPAAPAPQYASPKSGAVSQPFSGDELVYNTTMGDWRTHNGMDIAGKTGEKVKAPMAGTVRVAAEDELWGGVVEIEAGSVVARVCGLSKLNVKVGQSVSLGDSLGKLGEIPAESALDGHLHIEFSENGKLIDPAGLFEQK